MYKKLLFTGVLSLIFWGAPMTFAFEPNIHEQAELTTLKDSLNRLIEQDNLTLRNLYQQARDLMPHFTEEKTKYYLEHLRDFLLTKLLERKSRSSLESKEEKKNFLLQYHGSGLANAEYLTENCYGRYQTLDNLSFAYDFPTPLTIAVRYRESNCGYYLPKNGYGPFQITKKDYGKGEITRQIFETAIKDFLEFSKKKIQRYNEKNPDSPMKLKYGQFNYKDLYKFAGLYNGLSGGTVYGDI